MPDETRTLVTEDIPVSNTLILAALCLLGYWVIVALSFSRRAALAVGLLGAPAVIGVVWLSSGPRTLWLANESLCLRERGRLRRFPLSALRGAKTRWVPYKGTDLLLLFKGQAVRIVTLNEETQALRFEVGRRLQMQGSTAELSDETRLLLGLPKPSTG